jgi:hypothetical protein
MKKHTKIYLKFFNYGETDFIPCEICGQKAVDIHHLEGRGKGKDVIENLMALCRRHHTYAHEGKIDKIVFIERHKMFLKDFV